MTLIADSGSTKTAWCAIDTAPDGTHYLCIDTQGINPFQMDEAAIRAVLRDELAPRLGQSVPGRIFFYGAGCTAAKSPVVADALRATVGAGAGICVESDMLGAARAVCGDSPGTVCILGTGSNSCRYDGTGLSAGIPALGYILGDEGSGAYIGKRLVADVLKRQLPDDVCRMFFDEMFDGKSGPQVQAAIIQKVYREPLANRWLASLSRFCASHRDIPAVRSLLVDCFCEFFTRNLQPMAYGDRTAHFVGSIAFHYQDELRDAATQCGYTVGRVEQAPLAELINYHSNK